MDEKGDEGSEDPLGLLIGFLEHASEWQILKILRKTPSLSKFEIDSAFEKKTGREGYFVTKKAFNILNEKGQIDLNNGKYTLTKEGHDALNLKDT